MLSYLCKLLLFENCAVAKKVKCMVAHTNEMGVNLRSGKVYT